MGSPEDAGAAALDAGGPGGCPADFTGIAERNRADLVRLGFALSDTVIEGVLHAPQTVEDRRRARLEIVRVGRGYSFIEGMEVFVEPDLAELQDEFPQQVLLGFTSPGLPSQRADGEVYLGAPLVAVAADRRAWVEGALGYHPAGAPFVAEVEVVAPDDESPGVVLRVHEVLAGEVPAEVRVRWSRSHAARFPLAGPTRYLVSFAHVGFNEVAGVHLASPVDWRPASEPARAAVQAVLRAPEVIDVDALRRFAAEYSQSWVFHRAPRVVAADVTGLAFECCTGAGGTFLQYELTEDFRGNAEPGPFQVGGHAYYPEQGCAEGRLLALGPLGTVAPSEDFGCPMGGGVLEYLEGTPLYADRADTPAGRSDVAGWVAASPPLLRAHPPGAPLGPEDLAQPGPRAPWSVPPTVAEALMAGGLAHVQIVHVSPLDDGHRIQIETSFSIRPGVPEALRFDLATRCVDPRLLEVGGRWWMPVVRDRIMRPGLDEALFFVPGMAFDPEGPAERIANRLGALSR